DRSGVDGGDGRGLHAARRAPPGDRRRDLRRRRRLMRHDLRLDGPAFRLRPVTLDDAELIVALRTDPRLSQYIHRTSPDVGAQRDWLERYFARPDDYYFIVERRRDGVAEGTLGIYDLAGAPDARRAEWGRWVLRHGSLAAPESAWLVYR